MPIGLEQGQVRLVSHQAVWETLFEDECAALAAALGVRAVAIEHVGSTAIRAICAKPILDIAVGFASGIELAESGPALEPLGYLYRGENGVSGRVLHIKTRGTLRTHHVHVTTHGSAFWREQITFRDALNAHPDLAAAYEKLKRELAAEFATNRAEYTARKAAFIRQVLATHMTP